jgi:glycopeptide antibiotics resistance protein
MEENILADLAGGIERSPSAQGQPTLPGMPLRPTPASTVTLPPSGTVAQEVAALTLVLPSAPPDVAVTGPRLGRSLLAYLVAVTLVITLAPFEFGWAHRHGLAGFWTASDAIMNVVMFVPIGFVFGLTRPPATPARWWQAALLGLLLSTGIEVAQLFAPSRYSSPVDVATNTAGSLIGVLAHGLADRRIRGARTVRTLALELPLMGLVYLLVPLLWLMGLASPRGERVWLVLPVVAMGGAIMGAVHTAYLAPSRPGVPARSGWLVAGVLAWVLVALLPIVTGRPDVLVASIAVGVGGALLRGIATRRALGTEDGRRFELPTLRLVLPLFAAFVALSSLWPLHLADGHFSVRAALWRATDGAAHADVFRALEHIGAFTLVGYVIAEYHGRDLPRYRHVAWRVLGWGGGIALLLEVARGLHAAYDASGWMLVLTTFATLVGGRLYQLQRDHVRALVGARGAVRWTAGVPSPPTTPCSPSTSDRPPSTARAPSRASPFPPARGSSSTPASA